MRAPVALAVLGDPLAYTQSPALHRAGLASVGLEGSSEALRTPAAELGERLRDLARRGFLGANLTTPLKEAALAHLDRVSEPARDARSVNTVGFSEDGLWGDTTDGPGFLDLLESWGREPQAERVLLLGAGGAARSLALGLLSAGCRSVSVAARGAGLRGAWEALADAEHVEWGSGEQARRLAEATLIVNATPVEAPLPVGELPARALVVDLRYGPGPTAWVREARAAGREAYDGLGLLVFQARRSLSLWLARAVPVDPLACAVGWPR